MKKRDVIRLIEKRCRRLHQLQQQLLAGFDVEANHSFRVEVKKLRALLRILRHSRQEDAALAISKELQSFYRTVGEVRSLQLQRQFVINICREHSYPIPVGYMSMLYNREQTAREKVHSKTKKVDITRICHQLSASLPAAWRKEDAEQYTIQKREQLYAHLAATPLSDEALHKIRKLFKDLLYVWDWVEGVLAAVFPATVFSKAVCLRFTEKLGAFQDSCVALSFFEPAFVSGLQEREQKLLEAIQQDGIRKKEAQKRDLIDLLLSLKEELQEKKTGQQTRPVTASS